MNDQKAFDDLQMLFEERAAAASESHFTIEEAILFGRLFLPLPRFQQAIKDYFLQNRRNWASVVIGTPCKVLAQEVFHSLTDSKKRQVINDLVLTPETDRPRNLHDLLDYILVE